MVAYCRRRFFVDRRAEKVCDTIEYLGSRRLGDCVLLDDVRCDGSGHDGCQAGCRVYWKEAWLKRVTPSEPAAGNRDDLDGRRALLALVQGAARPPPRMVVSATAARQLRCSPRRSRCR
jgi:hypothetical protein